MTPEEAVSLCRYVKANCPQQAIDEFTPLAWADHLEDYPYADAKAAAKTITAKKAFVQISELLEVIRQIRSKRIAEAPAPIPPPGLTEPEERAWIGAARKRIADGEHVPDDEGRELVGRNLPELRALIARRPSKPEPEPLLTDAERSREPESEGDAA